MKKILLILTIVVSVAFNLSAAEKKVNVLIATSMGDITLELYPDKAPVTVKNFLQYVDSKYYDGLIFHRVINGFMVQGGGFDQNMKQNATKPAIIIEADNGLKNNRGTIAMARTSDPNSATSQFFINHKDNPFLDFKAKTNAGWGYAVFGKVIKGIEVVDRIAAVETATKTGIPDIPVKPVIIKSIKVVK